MISSWIGPEHDKRDKTNECISYSVSPRKKTGLYDRGRGLYEFGLFCMVTCMISMYNVANSSGSSSIGDCCKHVEISRGTSRGLAVDCRK